MVKQQISNLRSRVRFSYPAPDIPGKCYGSTADSKPAGRGSIPWLGAKFDKQ